MKFCLDTIQLIVDKIACNDLIYQNTIVIGDNSSGKSLLVKLLIQKIKEQKGVYFIDAVNRGFEASKTTRTKEIPPYKHSILETRLKEEYFNIKDSFSCYGTATERIEQIYSAFEDKVQALFEQLTGERFQVIYGDVLGEVAFAEGKGYLSSGYQAMLRLLLELVYYADQGPVSAQETPGIIVIDEIDEFLSPRYAAKIFDFLKEHFPQYHFVVTTHSADLIVSAADTNLVVLYPDAYEVIDVNDFRTLSEVQRIFGRVFGRIAEAPAAVEDVLRRLLNNKINGAWSQEQQNELEEIGKRNLSASQRLVYRQIMEW